MVRWHTWQLLGEDIGKLADNPDLFNCLSLIELDTIGYLSSRLILHLLAIWMGELDGLGGTVYNSFILDQPIHTENYIQSSGVQNNETRWEVYPPYINSNLRA